LSKRKLTLGLDYGTNSVRTVLVDVANGEELATSIHEFETGEAGIIIDPADHNLARQNPADYLTGARVTVKEVVTEAKNKDRDFDTSQIIGIGIDTTGSTPLPVDKNGTPLAMLDGFKDNPTPRPGFGRTIPATPKPPKLPNSQKKSIRNTWLSVAEHIHPNGSSAKSFIA